MRTVRIRFTKTGRARYISHLDLNRCMMRALRRAGIPVWYTQGFNPHPHIVFALPLSIFFESDCEVMDIRVEDGMTDGEIAGRIAAQMPEGIEIIKAAPPVMPAGDIAFAEYRLILVFGGKPAAELRNISEALIGRETIPVEKATKHRQTEIDVAPYWRAAAIAVSDGEMTVRTRLPASPQENINPSILVTAMEKVAGLKPDYEQIRRTGIFNKGGEPFE